MNNRAIRALWLAWVLLLGVVVAGGAGIVAYANNRHIAEAVMTAGATFGGAVTLLILILTFVLPSNHQ